MRARANPTWSIDHLSIPAILDPVHEGYVRDALYALGGAMAHRTGSGPQAIPFAFMGGVSHLFLPDLGRVEQDPYRDWDQIDMLEKGLSRWERQFATEGTLEQSMSVKHVDIMGELEVVPPGVVVRIKARQAVEEGEDEHGYHDDNRFSSAMEDLVLLLRDEQAIIRHAEITWISERELDVDWMVRNGYLTREVIAEYQAQHGDYWFDAYLEVLKEQNATPSRIKHESAGRAEDYA